MFSIPNSVLLVIDVQGHLAQRMHEPSVLIDRVALCIKTAKILNLPIIYTEQVPEKLGKTNPVLSQLLHGITPIEKTTFSCWESSKFIEKLRGITRQQIFVTGIEAHVCVFQTVSDLLKANYKVQVVTDAVSSRTAENKMIAFERMENLGAILTSTEMMATELIRGAGHPNFKEILGLIK
ncbi:MAG: hydrolase [Candidatus Omnitrophica bacterium]|nr:hydrolase [Candidatus Omnitrophota bacterium]